eukprot:4667003-Amphidinium_carterae.2
MPQQALDKHVHVELDSSTAFSGDEIMLATQHPLNTLQILLLYFPISLEWSETIICYTRGSVVGCLSDRIL